MKRFTWMYKSILAVVISLVTITMSTLPAYATPKITAGQTRTDETGVNRETDKFAAAGRIMERYLFVNNAGLLELSVETGESIGVDEQIFSEVRAGMERVNAMLQAGEISLNQIELVDGELLVPDDEERAANLNAIISCPGPGRTGVVVTSRWFLFTNVPTGVRVFLNDCRTRQLIAALRAGTQSVCSLILSWVGVPDFISGVFCGGLSILVNMGAAAIQRLNRGRGIIIQIKLFGGSSVTAQ